MWSYFTLLITGRDPTCRYTTLWKANPIFQKAWILEGDFTISSAQLFSSTSWPWFFAVYGEWNIYSVWGSISSSFSIGHKKKAPKNGPGYGTKWPWARHVGSQLDSVALPPLETCRCFQLIFCWKRDSKLWKTHGGFLKWWYPQIIHFNRVFHYKPSILGYHYFRKPPHVFCPQKQKDEKLEHHHFG